MTPEERTAVLGFPSEVPTLSEEKELYGLMAEFEEHEQLLKATEHAYAAGYREMDA